MPAQTDTFDLRKTLHLAQLNGTVGVTRADLRNLNPQYFNDIIPADNHSYTLKLPYTWTGAFLDVDRDSLYAHKADSLLSGKVVKDINNSAKAVAKQSRTTYKVKSGDYLGKIASRYGVTVSQLKKWNNLKSSNIKVGQTLYIYGSSSAAASSSGSSSSGAYYTVRSGDSLYTIAKLYPGVSAENIKKANGLTSNNIRPGQKLKIPIK